MFLKPAGSNLYYIEILTTLVSIVLTRLLIKLLNHRRRRGAASSVAINVSSHVVYDDEFSDDDDEDKDLEGSSDSCSEEADDEREAESDDEEDVMSKLKRVFSWNEFVKGKSDVVKLWDGIGLGLEYASCEQRITSILDKCRSHAPSSASVVISSSRTSFFPAFDSIVDEWDEVACGGGAVGGNYGNRGAPAVVYVGDGHVSDSRKVVGTLWEDELDCGW